MYAREFTRTVLRQTVTEELSEPKWLVVRLIRLWLWQPNCRPAVAATWTRALGPVAAVTATAALGGLLDVMASRARRTMVLHRPQRTLLTLLGAFQAGRSDHADAVLRWLLPKEVRDQARFHADRLSQTLSKGKVGVRCPAAPRPIATARFGADVRNVG